MGVDDAEKTLFKKADCWMLFRRCLCLLHRYVAVRAALGSFNA